MKRKGCWRVRRGGLEPRGRISRAGLGGLLVEVRVLRGMEPMGRTEGLVLVSERIVMMDCVYGGSLP